MRTLIFSAVMLSLSGCNLNNGLHVTAYDKVYGQDANPWDSGGLIKVENRTQRIIAIGYGDCSKIGMDDVAVINHKDDAIVWVNDNPYNIRKAEAK
jgi:hypothetical protein